MTKEQLIRHNEQLRQEVRRLSEALSALKQENDGLAEKNMGLINELVRKNNQDSIYGATQFFIEEPRVIPLDAFDELSNLPDEGDLGRPEFKIDGEGNITM